MILGELQTRQIMALHADGMSPEQIAQSLELDVALVKLAIAPPNSGDRDINDAELQALRTHALHLALGAENENVQAKMTQFLLERDKPSKKAQTINPVLIINSAIREAKGHFNDLASMYSNGPAIDVNSAPQGG